MNLLILYNLLLSFVAFPATTRPQAATILHIESPAITDRKWEMQEIRFLYNNTPYYYKQDDPAESNVNFDNDFIIFNSCGTGTYQQGNGIDYPLQWHFIAAKKNAIEFSISKFRDDRDLVVNWENIGLSDHTVWYTEYYTHKGSMHCLGYGTRISNDVADPSKDITAANINRHK